jgi:hypothetical protein
MGYAGQLNLGVRHAAVRADFEVQNLPLWLCFSFRFVLVSVFLSKNPYQSGIAVRAFGFALFLLSHPPASKSGW